MGTNREYLENPRRQSILKRLLDRADTLAALALQKYLLWYRFAVGFLRFSQDRSLKSQISKSTNDFKIRRQFQNPRLLKIFVPYIFPQCSKNCVALNFHSTKC